MNQVTWIRIFFSLAFLLAGTNLSSGQATEQLDDSFLDSYREAAVERWEKEIQRLEKLNESETHPEDSILFLGSSSIRRWDKIAVDMAPYHPIQRGYGGSKYSNVAIFSKRLIRPHSYRAVVIFVGNDISGKTTDNTPDEVEQFIRHVIAVSKAHQPDAPVLLIEVTPTAKRWAVWPKIRELNARIREIALSTPSTYFIATAEQYLDPDSQPRTELFVSDELHLNDEGYKLWSSIIRQRLDEVLRMETEYQAQQAVENDADESSDQK